MYNKKRTFVPVGIRTGMKRLLRAGMETLGLRKSLKEDSPGKKAINSQRDGVSVNAREESQCMDEDSENTCKDSDDEKMDTGTGEAISTLPDELVESILALLPFPYVFQARVLSKSWLARLSPISSQDDLEMKNRAISFQKRITEFSVNWKTFSPVVYQRGSISTMRRICLYGFDRTSHTWLKLPPVSLFPYNVWPRSCVEFSDDTRVELIEGSLLLLSIRLSSESSPNTGDDHHRQLYVANILTKSCTELPPRPCGPAYRRANLCLLVDGYKVIHFPDTDSRFIEVLEIYDSTSAAWTIMRFASLHPNRRVPNYLGIGSWVVPLDGVVYFVRMDVFQSNSGSRTGVPSLKVLALDVNEDTRAQEFNVVAEVSDRRLRRVQELEMVISKANLLMVILLMIEGDILVLKLDLQSRHWTFCGKRPVIEGPMAMWAPLHSEGDCIFTYMILQPDNFRQFGVDNDGDRLQLAYDVDQNSWSNVHPFNARTNQAVKSGQRISSSFRPNLSPFMGV